MKDYMQQVGRVVQLYVPPNPKMMDQAFKQGKVSFSHGSGLVDLVFQGLRVARRFDDGRLRPCRKENS